MAFSVDEAYHYLEAAHSRSRLAHAYLIVGDPEGPAWDLSERLISRVNAAGSAPTHVISPESKLRRIVIDQIRDLESRLRLKAPAGTKKVGVIKAADRLQPQAANAFLKTLEEPPGDSLLLLLSAYPEQMLETILSRCIRVRLKDPGLQQADPARPRLAELLREHFQSGAPGLPEALGLAGDVRELLAEERKTIEQEHKEELKEDENHYRESTEGKWLEDRDAFFKVLTESRYVQRRAEILDLLMVWWADVLRAKQGHARIEFKENDECVQRLAREMEAPEILRRLQSLEEMRAYLDRNIQEALVFDVCLVKAFETA